MMALLQQGGVAATYQAGTVNLTGAQFNAWTGITNATAACRLLADGGIPAVINGTTSSTCSYTGTVTTVTMSHIWINSGGQNYDPSFKQVVAVPGLTTLESVMQCATASCGSLAQTAALTGATSATDTAAGANYIQNVNTTALGNTLNGFATNLQSYLEANNATASIEDVVGGWAITPPASLTAGVFFPYASSSAQHTNWGTTIPNVYRTQIYVQIYSSIHNWVFADEVYGQAFGIASVGFQDESSGIHDLQLLIKDPQDNWNVLIAEDKGADSTTDPVTMQIDHPYPSSDVNGGAVGTYADDTLSYTPQVTVPCLNDNNTPVAGCYETNGFDIVLSLGYTGPGAITNASEYSTILTPLLTEVSRPISASFLAQSSRATALIDALNATRTQAHHFLGMVNVSPYGAVITDVRTSLSSLSPIMDLTARLTSIRGATVVDAALEGGAFDQRQDTWGDTSGVEGFAWANSPTSNGQEKFYDVNNTNLASVLARTTAYTAADQAFIGTYFPAGGVDHAILPSAGNLGSISATGGSVSAVVAPFYAYTDDDSRQSYVTTAQNKGAADPADPGGMVQQSIVRAYESQPLRTRYSVDLGSGTVSYTPPADLVTGVGEFPNSLSLQRTYNSTFERHTRTNGFLNPSGTDVVAGILSDAWTTNLSIRAELDSDPLSQIGVDAPALNGVQMVSALVALRDLLNASSNAAFPARLTAIFVANWLNTQFLDNSVIVTRGPQVAKFVRRPDGTFRPPVGSAEQLTQSGSRIPVIAAPTALEFDYSKVSLVLTDKYGATLTFGPGQNNNSQTELVYANLFLPQQWTFPNNVKVSFAYNALQIFPGDPPIGPQAQYAQLKSVSNNLGRALNFSWTGSVLTGNLALTVTDESNTRSAVFKGLGGSQTFPSGGGLVQTGSASAQDPAGAVTTYTWGITSGIPNTYDRSFPMQVFLPTSPAFSLSVGFDTMGRASGITDALGNQTNYYPARVFSEPLARGEVVDATAAVTTQYYDVNDHLVQNIDPDNRATSLVYYDNGLLRKVVAPEGNSTENFYDVRSNLLTVIKHSKPGSSVADVSTSTSYEEGPGVIPCANPVTCNLKATTTDADQNVTSYAYLSTGQLQRTTGPIITAQNGGVGGRSQTDYCYGATFGTTGNVSLLTGTIEKADPATNRVKSFTYNSTNDWTLLTSTTDPATTLVPPATAGGACTTATKTTPAPLALTTSYVFDGGSAGTGPGNVSSITDPRSNTTTYAFDATRRLTTEAAPLSTVTRYCYDSIGELLSTNRARVATAPGSEPNFGTEVSSGQCPSPFSPGSWDSETRTYFLTGDLQTVADPAGNTTRYAYDPDGRQQVVQDPDGRQTATVYDPDGQVLAKWRGGSNWINTSTSTPSASAPSATSAWTPGSYAGSGPLEYESFCSGAPQAGSVNCYTPNGKPLYTVDADGHITQYQYDGQDRLRIVYFADPVAGNRCTTASSDSALPGCSGQQTYELSTYDPAGNLMSHLSRRGDTITYQYDTENRRIVKAPAGQGTVTSGLDLLGEPYLIAKAANGTLPAHSTSYTYDGAGRTSSETNDGLPVSYAYDSSGNRSSTTWPDTYYVSYSYDALNRMQFVRENSSSTNELAYYSYDPLSRRTSLCMGAGTTSCASTAWTNNVGYGYETLDGELNALTQQLNTTTVAFGYARNHSYQITTMTASDTFYQPEPAAASTTYVPNDLNEYGSVGGQTSTYDPNGNLLTWFPPTGQNTYAYDSENRLISAAIQGSSAPSIFYDYDALGRRITKTTGGTGVGVGGTTTGYLLDGDEEIAEYNVTGGVWSLARRYITGAAVDERIAHAEGNATSNPTKTYYHTDHHGSVIDMTDNAGNVTQRMSYDEYGNLSAGSTATGEQFRYAGRRYDPETGLYYYRARYYAPQLGRFLQVDPLGYGDDPNSYAYVGNDPVDKEDPTGLWECVQGVGEGNSLNCTAHGEADLAKLLAVLGAGGYTISSMSIGEGKDTTSGDDSSSSESSNSSTSPTHAVAATTTPPGQGPEDEDPDRSRDNRHSRDRPERETLPKTRAELDADLKSKGFENKGTSEGGYTTYRHPDGRVVTIKPTGEVIPTSPAVSSAGKAYNQRTDYFFNRLADQSHSTGHFVEPYNAGAAQ